MPGETVRLFVYGTLMPGQANHRQIERHVRAVRPGRIKGILVDLGAFPALLHGEGIVRAMVLDVDAEAFQITDAIEGYHADRRHSLYVREKVQVDLHGGTTVMAWTYFFANPDDILDRPRLEVARLGGTSVFEWQGNIETEP